MTGTFFIMIWCISQPLFLGGTYVQPQEATAAEQTTNTCNAKILKVRNPDTVDIKLSTYHRPTNPPENNIWLIVAVELTPPKKGASLTGEKIRVFDSQGNSYPALSIYKYSEGDYSLFESFKDANGTGMIDNGNLLWAILNNTIYFQTTEPVKANLLYAVPVNASGLSFQVSDDEILPLPPFE